jgi:hypothetical protein
LQRSSCSWRSRRQLRLRPSSGSSGASTRTKLISYFKAKPGSIFDLASKPKSLAAYKRYILPLGK